jgi:hypothetical protein
MTAAVESDVATGRNGFRLGLCNGFQLAAGLLLAAHGLLLAASASCHSPTFNEPAQFAAGVWTYEFSRFDVYNSSPPLVRFIAGIPAQFAELSTDWSGFYRGVGARPEYELGESIIANNGRRSMDLIIYARWLCIPFSLVGGYVCYRWSKELYGPAGGILSALLWCFCPIVLGHAQLVATDIAATSLGVTAAYMYWRWLKQPSWKNTALSGVTLGIAELAKFTLLSLIPLWSLIWLARSWFRVAPAARPNRSRDGAMFIGQLVIAIYVLDAGYGFEDVGEKLGDFRFASRILGSATQSGALELGSNRFADTLLSAMPIPLPANYVRGVDTQLHELEKRHDSYWGGSFHREGSWYFYIYAFALKTPLGMFVLLGVACAQSIVGKVNRRSRKETWQLSPHAIPQATGAENAFLLAHALTIFAFVSTHAGITEHLRYTLPALPFLFILLGQLAALLTRRKSVPALVVLASLTWYVTSSLWIYPHSLSYFNELCGGPREGPSCLIRSNSDWGQDLLYLEQWRREHPTSEPLKLAYFGGFDPRSIDIPYEPLGDIPSRSDLRSGRRAIPPGWYGVSATLVYGSPHFIFNGDGSRRLLDQGALTAFREIPPSDMAGYSIYLYHVR